MADIINERKLHFEEISPKSGSGMVMLILNILLMLASAAGFIFGAIRAAGNGGGAFQYHNYHRMCDLFSDYRSDPICGTENTEAQRSAGAGLCLASITEL